VLLITWSFLEKETTMSDIIPERIAAARAGTNPTVICRMSSGWAVLCDVQFLRGYTILLADPIVASINDLDHQQRSIYLNDMALIGDALLEVTDAYRINYAVLGNTDPCLHAHIVPRYMTEPEEFRKLPPWSYPKEVVDGVPFDYERDRELIQQIAKAIQKRL
jgi:diadenosine tetraphosphate (Ap4A) HIT family hydrolase